MPAARDRRRSLVFLKGNVGEYQSWQFWAVISAAFAALTAIFAKIGVENISSNLATLIRAIVILAVTAAIVTANKEWQPRRSTS
jgi:transporter family protein